MKKDLSIFICLLVYNISTIQAQNDTIVIPKKNYCYFGLCYGVGFGYRKYEKNDLYPLSTTQRMNETPFPAHYLEVFYGKKFKKFYLNMSGSYYCNKYNRNSNINIYNVKRQITSYKVSDLSVITGVLIGKEIKTITGLGIGILYIHNGGVEFVRTNNESFYSEFKFKQKTYPFVLLNLETRLFTSKHLDLLIAFKGKYTSRIIIYDHLGNTQFFSNRHLVYTTLHLKINIHY